MEFIDAVILATGALDFALCFVVLIRNKKSRINISFAIFSFFLGAWAFSIAFFRILEDPFLILVSAKLIYISGSSIAASLLYFALIFPEGRPISNKKWVLILAPSLLHAFVLAIPTYLTREITTQSWGKEVILGKPEYLVFSIYFISFFYGALYILFHKYKNHTGNIKNQIFLILGSILLAGLVASVFDLFLPWFGNYRDIYVGPAFSMVIFWLVTYAIVKHRFLDIRLFVARSIAYSLLIIVLGFMYAIGLFFAGAFITGETATSESLIVSTVLALAIAFTFQPLRRYFEKTTDRIFYRDKYESEDFLGEMSKIMASHFDLNILGDLILKEAEKTLKVSGATILLTRNSERIWTKEVGESIVPIEYKNTEFSHFVDWVVKKPGENMLVFDELGEESNEKIIMRDYNASILIALVAKDETIGALILGEKSSGGSFSTQDIEVLRIIAPEIAVAVKNALSYEEIKKFNITLKEEIEKATSDLKNANERLKQLDKLKDEFVSLASHELRTPMTIIKSYIWTLQHDADNLNAKQKDYIEKTMMTTERLINLVNDMLNISRIESGRMELKKTPTDINEVIKKIVTELEAKAKELDLTLTLHLTPHLPQLYLDPEKIEQVLINLLGNALKFTPKKGSITVTSSMRDHDDILICIQDTGIGINEKDLPKLFKKFSLLGRDNTERASMQSTGLGLYLSKSIVELHGGKMWAASEGEGKGSTFCFTLPTLATNNTENEKGEATTPEEKVAPSQIEQDHQG